MDCTLWVLRSDDIAIGWYGFVRFGIARIKLSYLTGTSPKIIHRKTTSKEDNLAGRRPHRKTT